MCPNQLRYPLLQISISKVWKMKHVIKGSKRKISSAIDTNPIPPLVIP